MTMTMNQEQLTSMMTPSLNQFLDKTKRQSTDYDNRRESVGHTIIQTPNLNSLLDKTKGNFFTIS